MTAVPPRPAAGDDFAQPLFMVRVGYHHACPFGQECPPPLAAPDATAGDGLRDVLGRWMFQRSETWRDLCSPEDADWDEWVDRNREQWREEADAILAEVPALCDVLAAAARDAEKVRRVEELVAFYDRHEYSSLEVDDLRRALDPS